MREMVSRYSCLASDMDTLLREIIDAGKQRGLISVNLGQIGHDPLLLLRAPVSSDSRPCLLLAGGFHGEEPAGCWGLLDFLKLAPNHLFERAAISILPAVNPSGLRKGQRRNVWGENPNRGFCPASTDQPEPSREGAILLDNLPMLLEIGRDGFISLHEDNEMRSFYLFTFEKAESPGAFSLELKATEERYFPRVPDGMVEGSHVKEGIVFRECDGSFEDRMFHEGVPKTACTETPGLYPMDTRVDANHALAVTFVGHFLPPKTT